MQIFRVYFVCLFFYSCEEIKGRLLNDDSVRIFFFFFFKISALGENEPSFPVIAHMGTICTESSGLDSKEG